MNDMDRIGELIEGHLDETLSETERGELDRALAADPDAARRFVRAARLDNALYLHFHRRSAAAALDAALTRAGLEAPPAAALPPRWARAVDHVWGPLGAVLAHAALLLLLVRWVVLPARRPAAPVEVDFAREERLELEALRRALPPGPAGAPGIPSLTPPADVVRAPDAEPAWPVGPALPTALGGIGGRLRGEPEWMRGRAGPARAARLARHAPDWAERTEPALDGAIDWLARARRADGGWSEPGAADADPGLTALAVLAGFARGEPLSGAQTAVSWLMDLPAPDGAVPSAGGPDAQGVVACALIEAYARAPLPPLRFAAERAVERIVREQAEDGLWRGGDPWATSWRALALRTAAWAGFDAPELRAGLARAVGGLKTVEDPAGTLFRGGRPSARDIERVAATALALQWMGEGRSPEARTALAALGRVRLEEPDAVPGPFALHLVAQAFFNEGGDAWNRARPALADALLAGRAADGGWRAEAGSPGDGRVRATALAALSLAVCYRYPPAAEWPALAARRTAPALPAVMAWAAFPVRR